MQSSGISRYPHQTILAAGSHSLSEHVEFNPSADCDSPVNLVPAPFGLKPREVAQKLRPCVSPGPPTGLRRDSLALYDAEMVFADGADGQVEMDHVEVRKPSLRELLRADMVSI